MIKPAPKIEKGPELKPLDLAKETESLTIVRLSKEAIDEKCCVCGRDATIRVFAWGRAPEDDEDDIISGETYCDECKGAPLAEAG